MNNGGNDRLNYSDYLLIHILDGRLTAVLQFNGQDPTELVVNTLITDGKFHRLSLTQLHKKIELVLDDCELSELGELGKLGELSECRQVVTAPDDDERLNVVAPLQLGGVAPLDGSEVGLQNYPGIKNRMRGFNGCIRKLIVNHDHYDLYSPVHFKNSVEGCASFWGSACYQTGSQEDDSELLNNELTGTTKLSRNDYCHRGECFADSEVCFQFAYIFFLYSYFNLPPFSAFYQFFKF